MLANPQRRQLGQRLFQLAAELRIHRERTAGFDARSEQIANQHNVASGPHRFAEGALVIGSDECVFRRGGGSGHQPAGLGVHRHVIQKKLGGLLERRIGAEPEKLAIAGKPIALPQLRTNPDAAGWMHAPAGPPTRCGIAPRIGDRVGDPAPRAIDRLRGAAARFPQRFDETKQRLVAFG